MLEINRIHQGDCLELMKQIDDKSVDMILCDLPYGTTACKWDTIIPFDKLWEQYKRIIKDNGAIVLTASQPFTSALIMSNIEWFKCEWIWQKTRFSNQMLAKFQPLKIHENVLIFSNGRTNYYPQGLVRVDKITKQGKKVTDNVGGGERKTEYYQDFGNYPKSIQLFKNETGLHPTQKPVELFEYLIRTYSNEGDIVLDNCVGSGTTAIACINTNRNFIGMEKEESYIEICNNRILEGRASSQE
jgi:site-specific DNA-methyltransferase (adenine-specific)